MTWFFVSSYIALYGSILLCIWLTLMLMYFAISYFVLMIGKIRCQMESEGVTPEYS